MRKITLILIVIFFIFVIQNLLHSIYGLWQKKELLVNARSEVESAKKENSALREQIAAVKNPAFIEKQARDKLLLVRPGEQIVVASDKLIVHNEGGTIKESEKKSNPELWLELFIKGQ